MVQESTTSYKFLIGEFLVRLNSLTWGIRIEKFSERECGEMWDIFYISPVDRVWRHSRSETLIEALQRAVELIEGQQRGEVPLIKVQDKAEHETATRLNSS